MIDREIGPYRVKEQLPFRGPGRVFAGVHAVLGRTVRIREVPPGSLADPSARKRFLRAAKIVQRHAPGGLAMVHLCLEDSDGVLLVTEQTTGSLEERLSREGTLPPNQALEICRTLLEGVKFLHQNGIVHGNIGAHSVAFAEDGSPRLTEWGIPASGRSATPCAKASAEEGAGAEADLRAVGELLHRMVTGVYPGGGAAPLKAGAPGTDLDLLLANACATDPAERFSSAEEFAAALDSVPRGAPEQPADAGRGAVVSVPLLTFPGRRVPWGLLFGLMLVPLIFATMTRKTGPLPEVPHKESSAETPTEGGAAGGTLPALLPVPKPAAARPASDQAAPPEKEKKGGKKRR